MSSYTVHSFSAALNKWVPIVRFASKHYCLGYVDRAQGEHPRPALRITKEPEGRLIADINGDTEVSVGMVAGWPTPEQYRGAAARAIAKAERLEALIAEKEASK